MLVLKRRKNEELVIGGVVRIRILGIDRGQVRLGVQAPAKVRVDRSEVDELRRVAAGDREHLEVLIGAVKGEADAGAN